VQNKGQGKVGNTWLRQVFTHQNKIRNSVEDMKLGIATVFPGGKKAIRGRGRCTERCRGVLH
jgi:hypothetical protein